MSEQTASRKKSKKKDEQIPDTANLKQGLLQLLESDAEVRELIFTIARNQPSLAPALEQEEQALTLLAPCAAPSAKAESEEDTATATLAAIPIPEQNADPLRQELSPELAFLQAVRDTPWLAHEWLRDSENEGQALVRLVAMGAQWDNVLQLAEWLGEHCKRDQRPATDAERGLLLACVQLHNLLWKNRQAGIESAEIDTAYDFKNHQRGNGRGERIDHEWLPGLRNAAGELVRLPLVATS